ncbi:uncharacterized protein BYT42DRAFT_574548 [Radiomyces spectabilis]|uniref:uncharacterized protein n=1 Tax=Radiomyces spectabilis TaxID=64574 RepID=UPI00221F79ED|nr:uncharacterized protein BYT42DRAFT_574548 [Radiomyces spectabilis]KAI8376425.1 hypothetical protein BYT42DRAFT_574548 [Radiomyces spectabilis]
MTNWETLSNTTSYSSLKFSARTQKHKHSSISTNRGIYSAVTKSVTPSVANDLEETLPVPYAAYNDEDEALPSPDTLGRDDSTQQSASRFRRILMIGIPLIFLLYIIFPSLLLSNYVVFQHLHTIFRSTFMSLQRMPIALAQVCRDHVKPRLLLTASRLVQHAVHAGDYMIETVENGIHHFNTFYWSMNDTMHWKELQGVRHMLAAKDYIHTLIQHQLRRVLVSHQLRVCFDRIAPFVIRISVYIEQVARMLFSTLQELFASMRN